MISTRLNGLRRAAGIAAFGLSVAFGISSGGVISGCRCGSELGAAKQKIKPQGDLKATIMTVPISSCGTACLKYPLSMFQQIGIDKIPVLMLNVNSLAEADELLHGRYDDQLEKISDACRRFGKPLMMSVAKEGLHPDLNGRVHIYIHDKIPASNVTWLTWSDLGGAYTDWIVSYELMPGLKAKIHDIINSKNPPDKPILILTNVSTYEKEKIESMIVDEIVDYLVEVQYQSYFEDLTGYEKYVLKKEIRKEADVKDRVYLADQFSIYLAVIIPQKIEIALSEGTIRTVKARARHLALTPYQLFEKASRQVSLYRNHQRAISQLDEVADRCPGSDLAVASYMRIGRIYLEYLHDYPKAIEYYTKVVKARPGKPWAAHALFEIAKIKGYYMGQKEEGKKIYDRIIADFPDNGYFVSEAKRRKEALGRSVPLRMQYWHCEFSINECIRILRSDADQKTKNRILYYMGNHYFKQMFNFEAAIVVYQEFIKRGGDEELMGYALMFSGFSSMYLGKYDEAIDFFGRAKEQLKQSKNVLDTPILFDPISSEGGGYYGEPDYVLIARAFMNLEIGNIYLSFKNDRNTAIKYFREIEEQASSYAPIMARLAKVYAHKMGDYKKALEILGRLENTQERALEIAFLSGDTLEKYHEGYQKVIGLKPDSLIAEQARIFLGHELKGAGAIRTWSEVGDNSQMKPLALFLTEKQMNASQYGIEEETYDAELSGRVFSNPKTGERATLIFLHKLPITYVEGRVRMSNGILIAEYDQGFTVEFYSPSLTVAENNLVLKSLKDVGPEYFKDSNITFTNYHSFIAAGEYVKRPAVIVYPSGRKKRTLVHELGHYWDLATTGDWIDPYDPSLLFRRINYSQAGGGFRLTKMDTRDFPKTLMSAWRSINSEEDLAYSIEDYLKDPRPYVRDQMKVGNFKPALRYLFFRYLTPYNGKEFLISSNSPSLDFAEVEQKITGSVDPSIRSLLEEIKKKREHGRDYSCEEEVSY